MAKIAFLSYYSGVVDRGVETFLYELTKRLSNKNQITIFQAGEAIKNKTIRTYTIRAFAKTPISSKNPLSKIYLDVQSLKILLFTIKAIPKLIKGNFDLIVPLNGGWQTALIRLITKLINSKMLVSGHAGIGADDAWNLFFRPDVFVCLTTAQKVWAKKLTPEVQVEFIPNGVDLSAFNPQVKPKQLNLKKPIVICSSALVPYKRIDLAIRAVAKTNLSLLILGDGQLKGQLDTLAKRLLQSRYKRLTVSYEETPRYYRACDVFTLPSKTEAFGVSYLEAMACNLPIVATNDATRSEIIENAGILTEPTIVEKYAKDLEIATQTNYRNIPYNQALKFSWNKIAKKYSDLVWEMTGK